MIGTKWLVAGGVGLAALIGTLIWSGSAKADSKKTNTEKNKAAGGAAYAAGKAAGFTQGGIDASTTGVEDITADENADVIAASKKTDDPPAFLKGYREGYPAGFAAAEAAKKLGVTYAVSMEEPPPPPDAPPAVPPGKPSTYTSDPNSAGFNLAYGQGRTYGKNNKLDYAPGGGQANGLKTNDHYAASKKFDADQMILWSSSWDKGYQRGWDQGQAEYHTSGGGTTEFMSEDVGTGASPVSTPLLSVGVSLSGPVGSILSVGYEAETGALLRVGGVQVLGIRGAYAPPILAAKKKFSGGADYDRGFASGYNQCKKYMATGTLGDSGRKPGTPGDAGWYEGWVAGWAKCRKEHVFEGGVMPVASLSSPSGSPASSMESVERHGSQANLAPGAAYSMESVERSGSHPPPPPISQPLQSAIAIPTNQSYSLLNYW